MTGTWLKTAYGFLAADRHPDVVPIGEVERARQEVDGEELTLAERWQAGGRKPQEVRPALLALLWTGRPTTDLAVRPAAVGGVHAAKAWMNQWTTLRPGLAIGFDGEQFTVA